MFKILAFSTLLVLASARPQAELISYSHAYGNDSQTIKAEPATVVVNNDVSFGQAVDFSAATSLTMLTCLKKANYKTVFVRALSPAGNGVFDINAVTTIRNAYSAGLGIEVYMTPQPISSLQGYQQFDLLYNGLVNNGITVRAIWIQVTSPANWQKSTSININFINSIIARAKQYGLTVGIYSNQYDWNQITGNWVTLSSDILLWYWNVYGPGVSGETKPNFTDFRAFGPFKNASVKQYGQAESVCQITVNRDVYAVGIPSMAKSSQEASAFSKNGEIVVGGFVGN
uniref:Lysozyme n=1 Tax=Caenorhabditis japonica TaxID=281687 RepID=A0A8R1DF51_CAEJA